MTAPDTRCTVDHPAETDAGAAVSSPVDIRVITGALAHGVAVLTVVTADGSLRGTTVSAFTPVSFEPPLILVAVNRTGRTHQLLQCCNGFGLSVLAAGQESLARHFASRRRPTGANQFARVPYQAGSVTGSPLLIDTVARLDCLTREITPTGDHVLLIGDVITAEAGTHLGPLLHINHTYRRAAG